MSVIYNIECCNKQPGNDNSFLIMKGWAFSDQLTNIDITILINKRSTIPEQKLVRSDVSMVHPAGKEYSLHSGFSMIYPIPEEDKEQVYEVIIQAKEKNKKVVLGRYILCLDRSKLTTAQKLKFCLLELKTMVLSRKFPSSLREWKNAARNIQRKFAAKKTEAVQNANTPVIASKKLDLFEVWNLKHQLSEVQKKVMKEQAGDFLEKPLISIIMPAYCSDKKYLAAAVDSVIGQLYENWELIVVDDGTPDTTVRDCIEPYMSEDDRVHYYRLEQNMHISASSNYGVQQSKGEFLLFMDHDDLLTVDALFEVVQAINNCPELVILYSDDDKIDLNEKCYDPQFKPDYSPELLLSYMYFSHLFVVKRSLFDKVGGFRVGYEGSQDYDLALRAVEQTEYIIHVPKILYHWRATEVSTASSSDTKPYSIIAGQRAVEDAVARRNIHAEVVQPHFAVENKLGIYSLKYNGEEYPLISIIIPTKNQKKILETCVESILERTTYPNYELIIIDNESDETDAIQYLDSLSCTVIRVGNINGKFNYSYLINEGMKKANGEYVVLLNNDTEVIEKKWLEYMLVYMSMNGVGVVGAKLLYSDYRVQHAGVVLKMLNGIAGHAFKLIPGDHGGYLSYALTARNYSAVTAACFMTSRQIFEQVGGFNQDDYAVSYNDVDYCLRVKKAGYRIVFNPNALLFHHEGKTRGVEQTGHYSDAREEFTFYRKWIRSREFQDEYYSRNLSYENERFEIETNSRAAAAGKKYKVLLISHNLNFEGAPMVQYFVTKYLSTMGYEFTMYASLDGMLRKEYEAIGVKVIVKDINHLRLVRTFSDFCTVLQEEGERMNLKEYDLIYCNTVESFWGVKFGEMFHIPTIFGVHESLDYHQYFQNLEKEYHNEFVCSFSKATRTLFVSAATSRLYEELNTYNYDVIHNGIDVSKIEEFKDTHEREKIRAELGIDQDCIVVSVFGTVCERKGQLVFARAARRLMEKNDGKKYLFLVIGVRASDYLTMLQEYIKGQNLESSFRLIEYMPNNQVFDYYLATDIFVCSSFEESSPLVILEAMTFGTPIVSTDVFGIPELVRNYQDALLIPADDDSSMAEKIELLTDDVALREKLVENAYYRVHTYYTMEQMIDQYEILFREVIAEGNNRVYDAYYVEKNGDESHFNTSDK